MVCMYVGKTGLYVLHTYLGGRTEFHEKFFSDFPLLHDLMTKHGSNFQMQLLPLIKAHLKLLQKNFEKYFTTEQKATLDANSGILHPFDSLTTETEDLIKIFNQVLGLKDYFKETPYTEF